MVGRDIAIVDNVARWGEAEGRGVLPLSWRVGTSAGWVPPFSRSDVLTVRASDLSSGRRLGEAEGKR